MNRLLMSLIWLVSMLICLPSVLAQTGDWPRTLPLEQGMVTIYAPQIDDKTENIIHFRAALAYRATADSEPVFGAGWFESRVEIDSDTRVVHPKDFKVIETRFPDGTVDVQSELSAALAVSSPDWNLDFSLDELETALQAAETEALAVNTAPPKIVYRDHAALLISMDGDPVLREIKGSQFKAVINTPYPLIFDGKHYYLNAAKNVWYRARKATGPYQYEAKPPADIVAMVNANEPAETELQTTETITAANAPEIVVSTEPTELIVTDGPAAFVPLVDDLLVLENSQDDVFMHVGSQDFFIVLAGRWYRASSLHGPWTYEPADDLPVAFANIPRDSNQADSRVYVAGTEEARDAVLDAYVPQTAAVARGEVDIEVRYDGEPIYEPVDGTDLVYIENTGSTVLQADGRYYLVENGVWYISYSPNGPWQVSDHRPAQVDTILPTSPVHNVKYVHVYDSTPSVVYVGYTPGYTGSYVYRNTIFYGTGWYYRPWVSPYYYYPRHSTWGFNVSYNYWSGWNFGLSWGWGPFSVSYYSGGYWHHNHYWYHRHYGRWGPGRYRHRPVHHGYGRDRYARNDYGRGGRDRYDDGRGGNGDYRSYSGSRGNNLYRDDSQRARVAGTRDRQSTRPTRRSASNRQANYIAASGVRQKTYASSKKAVRYRTGPVSSSDLRLKASVRDANFEASRSRMLADNSGNVYRGVDRAVRRNDVVSRKTQSSKKSKSRITPSQRSGPQNLSVSRSRSNGKSSSERTTRTRTVASARQPQTRSADSRKTRRVSPASNTPVRQPRTVSSRKSAGQRSNRTVSASRQKYNSPRVSPQPQKVQARSSSKSAPVQSTSKKTSRKSSSKRSSSKNNSSKRSGKNRSRG